MPRRPSIARGKSLFGDAAPESKPAAAALRMNIDGGSRGNPGPAAYGVVIRDARGEIVAKLKKYIGRFTNNVAEYYGLIAAMDYAQSHGVRAIRVESDSELLVKQMRGQYKVKSADLQPLFERAKKMSQLSRTESRSRRARQRSAGRNRRKTGPSSGGGCKAGFDREERLAPDPCAFSRRRSLPLGRRRLAGRHGGRSLDFRAAKTLRAR